MRKSAALLFTLVVWCSLAYCQITIRYDQQQEPVAYAANRLMQILIKDGETLVKLEGESSALPDIYVVAGEIPASLSTHISKQQIEAIQAEGFQFRWINDGKCLLILASDAVGAQYGLLELADFFRSNGSIDKLPEKKVDPALAYRIVKFNLPWSPYRQSAATEIHTQTCRDLQFWERFLDMMVENRLNVLSLWNNHPFPYMIRAANFPEATPLNEREMKEWQKFWKALFRMARQRGIQTFIVNWNIVVSPEFAKAYGGEEYNDLSEQVTRYTRESVTQLINEYEDLTGLGVTLADWMGTFDEKMTPAEREDWVEATFVAGMKAADRPVKFLHRSVLAGDPMAMRQVIDRAKLPEPALVEIKFNWSHGHSTPHLAITHDYHSGELDNRFWTPKPENYNIQWMIRNEDFFILRWGQPDFIRKHIEINNKDYVNGYFIGSEGYIPAKDYSHRPSAVKTWQYAFEKQWLFYKMWGRLLYDPATPDDVFVADFDLRYGKGTGKDLLEAWKLASQMPLRLASFHRSTWDYTLYSEGFISAEPSSPDGYFDRSSPFISILEFIDHETLDPNMLSISEYVQGLSKKQLVGTGIVTPLALAEASETDSRQALALAISLRTRVSPFSGALVSELDDISTWSYLGLYFADKLRAGVALEKFRKTGNAAEKDKAIQLLEKCLAHWDQVIRYTKERYVAVPHVSTQHYGDEFREFSWELLRPQVERDVALAREATYRP